MNNQEIQHLVNLPECKIFLGNTLTNFDISIEKNLTANEISYFEQLNTIHKQNQFKLIRVLRTASLGLIEIKYKVYGAPFLTDNNMHISISHKNNYVVFGSSPFKIGIDLEEISERVKKVKSKFLNEQELNEFYNETDEIYTQLWAAKEAIYKTMKPPLSFKNDIKLSRVTTGEIIGRIFDNENIINLNFIPIKDYILCYVLL
jgi:phosphopantetheinyl transferase (holo-ACP synthase)